VSISLPHMSHVALTNCTDAQTAPRSPPKGSRSAPASQSQTNVQHAAAPVLPPALAQNPQDPGALLAALSGFGQQTGQANAALPGLPFLQNMVPPPPPPGFVPPPPPAASVQSAMPPPPPAGVNDLANQILQAMSAGTIAPDQAIQVLNALAVAQNGGASLLPAQPPVAPQAQLPVQPTTQNGSTQQSFEQKDAKMRDRSRSPDYRHHASPNRRSPPNRRESPVYGAYDPSTTAGANATNQSQVNGGGRGRGKARGGRNDRNEYRQRTPPAQRRQPSPPRNVYGQSRYIEWDQSLPRDNIRVLSRTLFVGGAGGTEGEIRAIFNRFGRVQTCIVNQDKRHAFVKMLTRPDAVAAKEGMDSLQDPVALSKARQVNSLLFCGVA
jgi:protein NRD1